MLSKGLASSFFSIAGTEGSFFSCVSTAKALEETKKNKPITADSKFLKLIKHHGYGETTFQTIFKLEHDFSMFNGKKGVANDQGLKCNDYNGY